jgi:PAS domain S-box-containing protein
MKAHAEDRGSQNTARLALPSLRQRAEDQLRQRKGDVTVRDTPLESIQETLHELQVHQIELEMQNEELQRSRADLETSFSRYFALYDLAPVGYCTVNPQGRILRANLTLASLLSATKSAIEQQPFARFLHRNDADAFYLACKAALAQARPQSHQLRLNPAADSCTWVLIIISPEKNQDGAPVLQVALTDINESHNAETAVRESEARYQALTESVHEGVVTEGPDGIVRTWNSAAARMFGYSASEAIGRQTETLYAPAPSTAGPSPGQAMERIGRRQDGSEFPVECSTSEWSANGNRFKTTITRDITDRKRSERAAAQAQAELHDAQKQASLATLAGGLSHDLNNQLGGILNSAELAGHDLPAESLLRPHLARIKESARQAAAICQELEMYSGHGPVVLQKLSLNSIVEETTERLKSALSKSAEFRLKLAPNLPPLRADALQIQHAVMNLVINASEALDHRAGRITLTTGTTTLDRLPAPSGADLPALRPGNYVFLDIADTGCGMDPETQARIFDPFFTTKHPGRGLGLSSALGTARGHHGTLICQSVPGAGTSFRLLLPCADEIAPAPARPAEAKPGAWRSACRILVVDDDESMRFTTAALLEMEGFEVDTAVDGREAVDLFRADPDRFKLVITDLMMPRLTGDKVCAEIQQCRPDAKVILMSGYPSRESAPSNGGGRVTAFLKKPFEVPDLLRAIERAVHA